MKMPTVMGHKFSEVPQAQIPRSQFDRSFGYKTTFDAGYLVPFFVDEALPGDTFQMSTQGFARLATPLKPIMDNMYMETFFFAVPYRLVWDNFQRFMGEQADPDSSTDFIIPIMSSTTIQVGSLSDYFGLPAGVAANITHSSLWHRAYNLIWNEFFRDQNIQDSVVVDKDDGPDTPGDYVLLRRGKRHDYFTSCLPWPQKGAAVALPLGTSANIHTGLAIGSSPGVYSTAQGAWQLLDADLGTVDISNTTGTIANRMYADLSSATGATINELRQAFQLQKLLERDARGGTRYTEKIKAHFGVTSPDARLQRPEYLGGGTSQVTVSPIAQTSSSDVTTPQGNLAAIGTSSFGGHGFVKSFTEHTLLLGMVCVRADLTYQRGLERMWSRSTQYDLYWPALAQIGEQAVLQQELFASGVAIEDEVIFGYQERYAEYRYKPSRITGLFRSTAAGSLDIWHLSQEFTVAPTLSPAFIVEDPPVDRVIAVSAEPHFLFDSFSTLKCARPMPLYGVPGLIDHF